MDQAEASGKTVDDALNRALQLIGATRADLDEERVEMVVLDEGRRGMFGVGARDARVLVRRVVPATPAGAETPAAHESRQQSGEQQKSNGGRRSSRGRRGRAGSRPAGTGAGSAPRRSGRAFEVAEPKLTEADFLRPPRYDEETQLDEEPGEEAPAPAQASAPRGRRRRRRGGGGGGSTNQRQETRQPSRPRDTQPEIEPDINAEEVELAATVVDDLLRILGVSAELTIREPLTVGDGRGSVRAVIDITGDDLGVLIGRRGETLLSLQYLVNLIVTRRYPGMGGVTIDAEHYRHRREAQIVALAERMAERVRQTGNPITLEPMTPAERRIVHLALADDPDLVTNSVGEGENRKVVISTRH